MKFHRFAAATLFLAFFVALYFPSPLHAQGDPTPTNTPRATPTNETPPAPTPTFTVTPVTPASITPTNTNTPIPGATSTPIPGATNTPIAGSGPATGSSLGSIRGTVYEDKNNDGKCVGQNEPILSGIIIEFMSQDGQNTVFLESGSDGSYGLVAAGYGPWKVTAKPPAGYTISSAASQTVTISAEQPVALNVDFCVRKGASRP